MRPPLKKTLISLLAAVSLVSLTGCGALVSVALSDQSSSQSSASETTAAEETTPAETTEAAAAQATETPEATPTPTPTLETAEPAPAPTTEAAPVEAAKPAEAPVEEEPADPNALEVGKEVQVGDYSVTVTKLKIVKDWNGDKVLKVTYDWRNNSHEAVAPFLSISFKGFQDGVETDWPSVSDHIDLSISQREVKPGSAVTGVQDAVGITDMSKPLVIELEEAFSFETRTLSMTIDDLKAL